MESPVNAPASAAPAPVQAPASGLRRSLGFVDLVAFGLAYMAVVAPLTNLGFVWVASGGLIASAYVVAAVCMYFTAQSYARMSLVVPSCGSVYGFARHSLGDLTGFMAGWLILLDYLLTPALVFVLMSVGMNTLVPSVDRATWICLVVAACTLLSWFGAKVTTRVSAASVVAQFVMVGGVLVLAVIALHEGSGTGALSAQPFVGAGAPEWSRMFSGASIAVMTFLGFDAVSTLSEEVHGDDRRVVARATMAVLLLAGGLYVLVAWVIGNLMPAIHLQDPAAAIFELLGKTAGPWAPILFAWLLAIIVGFTNALPMLAGVSRVLFAMGRDRQLPALLGTVHAGTGVPRVALLTATASSLGVALALRDRVELLASLVSFGALAGFVLLHLSVLVHESRTGTPRRAWLRFVSPAVGLVLVIAVLTAMRIEALQLGLIWLVVGLVYGTSWRSRGRRALRV
jgi:amino acid transporter